MILSHVWSTNWCAAGADRNRGRELTNCLPTKRCGFMTGFLWKQMVGFNCILIIMIVRERCQKHFFRDDHYTEAVALPYFEVCDKTIFG